MKRRTLPATWLCGLILAVAVAITTTGCGNLDDVGGGMYVRYTPQGTLVAFTGHSIDIYQPDLSKLEASFHTLGPPDRLAPNSEIFSLSDDGTTAAVAFPGSSQNHVQVFSIGGKSATSTIDLGPPAAGQYDYAVEGLALSPRGDLLFVMSGIDGGYRNTGMFDATTGARLWQGGAEEIDWGFMPTFSSDEHTLFVSGHQGPDLLGLDARTGATVVDAPLSVDLSELAVTPNAQTLIGLANVGGPACNGDGLCNLALDLFSTADGSVTREMPLVANTTLFGTHPLGGPAFRCSTAAGLCVVGVDGPDPATIDVQVQIWSMDGALVQTVHVRDQGINDVAVSNDGRYVAVAKNNNDVAVYKISDGSLVQTRHYSGAIF
jgi:WD40 repeat protein